MCDGPRLGWAQPLFARMSRRKTGPARGAAIRSSAVQFVKSGLTKLVLSSVIAATTRTSQRQCIFTALVRQVYALFFSGRSLLLEQTTTEEIHASKLRSLGGSASSEVETKTQ